MTTAPFVLATSDIIPDPRNKMLLPDAVEEMRQLLFGDWLESDWIWTERSIAIDQLGEELHKGAIIAYTSPGQKNLIDLPIPPTYWGTQLAHRGTNAPEFEVLDELRTAILVAGKGTSSTEREVTHQAFGAAVAKINARAENGENVSLPKLNKFEHQTLLHGKLHSRQSIHKDLAALHGRDCYFKRDEFFNWVAQYFGDASSEPPKQTNEGKKKSDRGRKPGSGTIDDIRNLEEMKRYLDDNKKASIWRAAGIQAVKENTEGASAEATQKRLSVKFRKTYPEYANRN